MAASNGKRGNRRPRFELRAPGASPQEAAAIAAAIEQFLLDTAPPPPAAKPSQSPWQRAALLEGVGLAHER